jgi:hypothetical protein
MQMGENERPKTSPTPSNEKKNEFQPSLRKVFFSAERTLFVFLGKKYWPPKE